MTPEDIDFIVRTVYGEAGNQSPEGQKAVAAVILNRAKQSGLSPREVVLAQGQFEPWNNPDQRSMLESLDPSSKDYQRVARNIVPALAGEDPTGGADHFYSPKGQKALGREAPAWDDGSGRDIGDHRFFSLGWGGQNATPIDVSVGQVDPRDMIQNLSVPEAPTAADWFGLMPQAHAQEAPQPQQIEVGGPEPTEQMEVAQAPQQEIDPERSAYREMLRQEAERRGMEIPSAVQSGAPPQAQGQTQAPQQRTFSRDELEAEALRRGIPLPEQDNFETGLDTMMAAAGISAAEGVPIVGPTLRSGVESGVGALRGLVRGEPWDEATENVNRLLSQAQEAHPVASTVGEFGGAIAAMHPIVRAAPALWGAGAMQSIGGQMAAGGASGGALAAADAIARGQDPTIAGLTGAAISAAGSPFGHMVGRLAERMRGKLRPLQREGEARKIVEQEAQKAFNHPEVQNLSLGKAAFHDLRASLDEFADARGVFRGDAHPGVNSALADVKRLADEATTEVPWAKLQGLRQEFGKIARKGGDQNRADREVASQLTMIFDDFLDSADPSRWASGDYQAALPHLAEGRALWRAGFKYGLLDTAINEARRGEERFARALRKEVRDLIGDKSPLRHVWTPDEHFMLDRVATLSSTERIMQEAETMRSMVLAGVPSAALGVVAGGPLGGIAGGAIGAASGLTAILGSRVGSDKLLQHQMNMAARTIRPPDHISQITGRPGPTIRPMELQRTPGPVDPDWRSAAQAGVLATGQPERRPLEITVTPEDRPNPLTGTTR